MIPDKVKVVDIYDIFGCNGDIVEVNIAPYRNKLGRRFGFARFNRVEDVRMLAVRLHNIVIDGKKIHANPPRFSRIRAPEEGKAKGVGGVGYGGVRRAPQSRESEYQHGSWVRGGRSFAEALGNKKIEVAHEAH